MTVEVTAPSGQIARGECEPHEWDRAVAHSLLGGAGLTAGESARPDWLTGLTRDNINERLARSPLRNAVDCALWDLDAKAQGVSACRLAGFAAAPVPVMPTIGIDAPKNVERQARALSGAPWIKLKVGAGDGLDEQRLEALASGAPHAVLLLDANCAWSVQDLERMLPLANRLRVRIIEQPMSPALNDCMPKPPGDILFCADESCLDCRSLPAVQQRFQYINIKLDKAGGLTEALALRREAERRGLGVMVGMMSGTSLAVAPAWVLAQGLDVVDLELGFMTRDREPAMIIRDFVLQPPDPALWG